MSQCKGTVTKRLYLRNDEREPVLTEPPEVGVAVVRVEPPAVIEPVRAEQEQITVGILDGFVHGNDPPEAHGFQFLVAELLTDETGDFSVWCGETTAFCFGTNLLGDPVAVLEEHALEDGDLVGHAVGRCEVVRAKQLLGIVAHAEALALQTSDPPLTTLVIRGDREVDDAVLFAPSALGFGDCDFSANETIDTFLTTEDVPNRLNAVHRFVILCHFVLLARVGHLG